MKVTAKKVSGLGLALALLLGAGLARAGDLRYENPMLYAGLRDQVLAPLYQAMQAGDLGTIKRYLQGDTYEQYRILLERNKNYSQFLKNYYAGATFEVGQIVTVDRDYVADILIYWPTGQTSIVKLRVASTQNAPAGRIPSSVQSTSSGKSTYSVSPVTMRRPALPLLK